MAKKSSRKKELSTTFDTRQHMKQPDYEIFYYRDVNLKPVRFHVHEYYEFFFFLEGEVDYQVGSTVYPLEYGDFLLIPPGVEHRPRFRNAKTTYRRFVLWFSRDFYQQLAAVSEDFTYGFERAGSLGQYRFHCSYVPAQEIQTKLIELVQEHNSQAPFHSTNSRLIVASFLMHINRMLYQADHLGSPIHEKALYLSLCDYINNHLEEDLSLESLAGCFYVSKYHVSHVFKDNMGISPHQYMTKKRLQTSKQEILLGVPLNQISFRYGFQDYTSYYRAFKKEFGLSPTEFREQNPIPESSSR